MNKLLAELKIDVNFIKSHTLQPKWYKVLKVLILLGFFAGYWRLSGLIKTAVFFIIFFFLSLLLHLLYRYKTNKFTQSWLDFQVAQDGGERKAKSIGKFYYSAIVTHAVIALIVSQLI